LRDLEIPLSNEALCVSVYEAIAPPDGNMLHGGKSQWFGLAAILIQFIIAAEPVRRHGDWGIIMVTAVGTCAAILTAALPQWKVEKLACRVESKKKIAITTGNGSRHIIVILGAGKGLDIEDLAAGESPRQGRPWIRSGWSAGYVDANGTRVKVSRTKAYREYMKDRGFESNPPVLWINSWLGMKYFKWYHNKQEVRREGEKEIMDAYVKKHGLVRLAPDVKLFRGLPRPFWVTRFLCGVFILLWAAVLISVMALKENAWYLVGIGTIGMIQNGVLAAASRRPETRGFHLTKDPMIFVGAKVMDVLMDLEQWESGCGRSLLKEFFPGGLDTPHDRGETDWWDEKKKGDEARPDVETKKHNDVDDGGEPRGAAEPEVSRDAEASRDAGVSREVETSREVEASREAEPIREVGVGMQAEASREVEASREAEVSRESELSREAGVGMEAEAGREIEPSRVAEASREAEVSREAGASIEAGASREAEVSKEAEASANDVVENGGEGGAKDQKGAEPEPEATAKKDVNRYDNDRYQEQNRGLRYDKTVVETEGTPSRGQKGGGISREAFAAAKTKLANAEKLGKT
jgi:hypothetical protein